MALWGHQPAEPQPCRGAPGASLWGALKQQFAPSRVLGFNLPSLSPFQEQKAQKLPALQVRSDVRQRSHSSSTRCDRGRPVANA